MRSDGSLAAQHLLTVSRLGAAPRALPCQPFGYHHSGTDIPRIASCSPGGDAIGVSDGRAIWACEPKDSFARLLHGGDEPDWQPLR
jgi:hypothetical protein